MALFFETNPQKPDRVRRRERPPGEPLPTWIEVNGDGVPTGAVVSLRHPPAARDGCRWTEATLELLAAAYER